MNTKALRRYMLEEDDFTLELMGNYIASQDIGLPSSKDLKKDKAIVLKKVSQNAMYLREFKSLFCNSKYFRLSTSCKMKSKKSYQH